MFEGLRDLNLMTIIIRTSLSLVIGGIIGMERERKNHPAGFRTHMLVCLGATLVMMTNQFISTEFTMTDISRLGAQVISGIGFLGAGTIIVTRKNQVRGLTTAAGLWAAACIGLAIGIGFYEGAIVASVLILIVMTLLHKVDLVFHGKSLQMQLYIMMDSSKVIYPFVEYCRENDYKILDIQITKDDEYSHQKILLVTIRFRDKQNHIEILEELSNIDGIIHLEEI